MQAKLGSKKSLATPVRCFCSETLLETIAWSKDTKISIQISRVWIVTNLSGFKSNVCLIRGSFPD